MPRLRGIAASSFAVAVITLSCANLPSLRAGACGNGAIEPANNEECDSFAPAGSACRAASTPGECRYDCGPDPSSTTNALHACPPGFACGTGSICRAASGAFVQGSGPIAGPEPLRIELADFDGDGRADLMAESADDVRVHYFDAALASASVFRTAIPHARTAIGQLTPDTLADLVVTSTGGVTVLRGAANQTLAPTVYPSFPVAGKSVRMIPVEALPQNPGVELFVFGGDSAGASGIARVSSKRDQPAPMFILPALPDQFAGEVNTANVVENLACNQIMLAFQTESKVRVYSSCRATVTGVELNMPPQRAGDPPQKLLPDVIVPGGVKVTGLHVGHINHDVPVDHMDLLINTAGAIYVAYGVGDGTFHSSAAVPASGGDGTASLFPITIDTDQKFSAFPLAIGDLNGDGLGDFVLPNAIVFNRGDGVYTVSAVAPQKWSTARIADLNGNRFPDVLAASQTAIDFYNGTFTRLLNHTAYTAAGAVGFVTIGDVDGDLVNDVVLRESTTDTSANGGEADDLAVMFGRPLSFPEAPAIVGRLPQITEIAVAPFEASLVNENAPADGIADIAVLSKNTDQTLLVAALAGRADRQLTSPFFLIDGRNLNERALFPSRFAVGAFTAQAHSDIASVAFEFAADGKSLSSRLWIAPLSGEAAVDTNAIKATANVLSPDPDLPNLDFDRAELVAVDLDEPASGTPDELVALVPPIAGSGASGALYIGRLQSGVWVTRKLAFGGDAGDWKVARADMNADGAKDVVVLYGDKDKTRKMMVLWNRGSGDLDPAGTPITMPAENVTAFACLNFDRDAALELAMVAPKSVYLAKMAAQTQSFPNAPPALAGVAGGTTIAAGDIDGDGVADLAIGSGGGIHVYAGVPAVR